MLAKYLIEDEPVTVLPLVAVNGMGSEHGSKGCTDTPNTARHLPYCR